MMHNDTRGLRLADSLPDSSYPTLSPVRCGWDDWPENLNYVYSYFRESTGFPEAALND
jgi:hypothetical protein